MNGTSMGVSANDIREVMAEQIYVSDYTGDSMTYRRLKSTYDNNIQCKKKQIAKRRAKNKNKKR